MLYGVLVKQSVCNEIVLANLHLSVGLFFKKIPSNVFYYWRIHIQY